MNPSLRSGLSPRPQEIRPPGPRPGASLSPKKTCGPCRPYDYYPSRTRDKILKTRTEEVTHPPTQPVAPLR